MSDLLRQLGKPLTEGKFDVVLDLVNTNRVKYFKGQDAMYVFVKCTTGIKSSNSPDSLIRLLDLLDFEVLKDDAISNYLLCLYHIFKYLVEKKGILVALKMENLLLKDFPKLNSKQTNDYKIVCKLFHFSLKDAKDEEGLTLMPLLVKLTVPVYGDQEMSDRLKLFGEYFFSRKDNLELLSRMLNKILTFFITAQVRLPTCLVVFKNMLPIITSVCEHMLSINRPDLISQTLSKISQVLNAPEDNNTLTRIISLFNNFTTVRIDELVQDILFNSKNLLIVSPLIVRLINKLVSSLIAEANVAVHGEVVLKFHILAVKLVELVTKNAHKCCCAIKYDQEMVLLPYVTLVLLAGYGLKNNYLAITKEIKEVILSAFYSCYKLLKISKINNCELLGKLYETISRNLYNFSIALFRIRDPKCLKFLDLLLRGEREFENFKCKKESSSMMKGILDMYSFLLMEVEKDYMQAIVFTSLNIFLHPDKTKAASQYMRCKQDLGERYLVETIVSILNGNEAFVKTVYPSFAQITDTDLVKKLLLIELSINVNWKNYKAIASLLKQLLEVSDAVTVAEQLMTIPIKDVARLQSNVKPVIAKVLDEMCSDSVLFMFLNYLMYQYSKQDIIDQNISEMLAVRVEEKPQDWTRGGKDEYDKCDIIAVYNHLQIEQYNKVIEYLNIALAHLHVALKEQRIFDEYMLGVIFEIAHCFRLECYEHKALECWKIALQVAMYGKNKKHAVMAASYLLELLDESSEDVNSWREFIRKSVDSLNNMENDVICMYYVCEGFSALKNGRIEECLRSFENATHYFELLTGKQQKEECSVLYELLCWKISNLPCSISLGRHDSFAVSKLLELHKALYSEVFYSEDVCTLRLLLFFEVTENIVNMFESMKFPREMRCYGKYVLTYAQKVVLPFRTSRFLLSLANADLLNCNYDDCKVKLEGLSYILMLDCNKIVTTVKSELLVDNKLDIEYITNGIQEVLLDCQYPTQQKFTSSPSLEGNGFKHLKFLSDPENCGCFQCGNFEYQNLVMQKMHLEALLCETQDSFNSYNLYIKDIQRLCDKSKTKFGRKIQYSYMRVILDLIRYNLRKGNIDVAKTMIAETFPMFEAPNFPHYIKNEILYLKLLTLQALQPQDFQKVVKDELYLPSPESAKEAKTPDKKMSKVNFKVPSPSMTPSPDPERPVRSSRKRLDLNPESTSSSHKQNTKLLCHKLKSERKKVPDIVVETARERLGTTRKNLSAEFCFEEKETKPKKKAAAPKVGLGKTTRRTARDDN